MAAPRAPAVVRAEVARLLAGAVGAEGRAREWGTARLPGTQPGAPALVVEVLPVGATRSLAGALALVLMDAVPVHATAPPPLPPVEALQERWGLTPAEAGVAGLLAKRGTGSKALARELGVSPATVRTHLQRVREKTGTHGQAALAALLLHGTAELA